MTQTYWPMPSGSAGAQVLEPNWSLMARNWLATGVLKGFLNELAVTADGTAMQVSIDTGAANIMGAWFKSDAPTVMPIAYADATNPRIDVIALRLDWVANTVAFVVLEGTPAANPAAPALTQTDLLITPATARWEIALANVEVPAAATTITAADVTDKRTFTGLPTATPTAGLPVLYGTNGGLSSTAGAGNVMTVDDVSTRSDFLVATTAAQSFAANNFTVVIWNTVTNDNLGEFDSANNRFVAKKNGLYVMSAGLQVTTPTANTRFVLELFVNGATNNGVRLYDTSFTGISSNDAGLMTGMAKLRLNAGDVVDVRFFPSAAVSSSAGSIQRDTNFFSGTQIA